MPESPVCTCITQPLAGTNLRFVRVFDPFCQIDRHKTRGTSLLDPVYPPKEAGHG